MNYESWNVDLETASATHATGARVVAEGDPANPCGVHPSGFSDGISAIDQVRLVRCGLEAIAKAARANKLSKAKQLSTEKITAERAAHKPTRPVLSLKKKAVKEA